MFIDTHAHLNFNYYKKDLNKTIRNAFSKNVKKIINIGSNYQTSLEAIKIAENFNKYEEFGIYASVGLHPIHLLNDITETHKIEGKEYSFVTKKELFDEKKYLELAKNKKVVAIGETGIDFYRLGDKNQIQNSKLRIQNNELIFKKIIKLQIDVFKKHIEIAKILNIPLMIHCRGSENDPYKAYDILIKILDDEKYFRGIVHCFTGNLEQARKLIKLGFYLGINGIVTFDNAKELQEIVSEVELKNLVLETDCPFLAPVPFRGEQNEPALIPLIAKKIAELKNVNIEIIENIVARTTKKLFKI